MLWSAGLVYPPKNSETGPQPVRSGGQTRWTENLRANLMVAPSTKVHWWGWTLTWDPATFLPKSVFCHTISDQMCENKCSKWSSTFAKAHLGQHFQEVEQWQRPVSSCFFWFYKESWDDCPFSKLLFPQHLAPTNCFAAHESPKEFCCWTCCIQVLGSIPSVPCLTTFWQNIGRSECHQQTKTYSGRCHWEIGLLPIVGIRRSQRKMRGPNGWGPTPFFKGEQHTDLGGKFWWMPWHKTPQVWMISSHEDFENLPKVSEFFKLMN